MAVCCSTTWPWRTKEPLVETFGSTASFTGDPIGGSEGYDRLVTGAVHHLVSAPSCGATNHAVCLRQALVNASAGQIVYVDDAMDIDVCSVLVADPAQMNLVSLVVKAGVTLASGRGKIINGV